MMSGELRREPVMSGRDRCEEILRLIDEALDEYDRGRRDKAPNNPAGAVLPDRRLAA